MPYFGSTLFVASIAVLVLLSLAGAILFASAIWGKRLTQPAEALGRRPVVSVLIGLPLGITTFLVAAVLLGGGPGMKLFGLVLGIGFVCCVVSALAVLSAKLGELLPVATDEGQPYRRILRGAAVLELAAIMPGFGWFVVFPLSIAAGLGAIVLASMRRAPSPALRASPSQQPQPFAAEAWQRDPYASR